MAGWLPGLVMVDKKFLQVAGQSSMFMFQPLCLCLSQHLVHTAAYLTGEETKAQGSQETCLDSLRWVGYVQPGLPDPESLFVPS